jgi:hypothetical protein
MQQAAEALAQAARQIEPGQQPKTDAKSPSPNAEGGGAGGGAKTTVNLEELESNVQRFAKRDWGQLPGQLQTEILQSAGRTPNSNYAKLIRLYFREIAENKSTEPTVVSPRDGRDDAGDSKSSPGQRISK